jgi:hypothetical protein
MAGEGVVVGVAARTGWAAGIALSGVAGAPRFEGRCELDLATDDLPGQPYHAAAGLDLAAAEELIGRVEQFAEEAAADALRTLAGGRPVAVAVVVKAVSLPDSLAQVRRVHAWMHAAEGVLYREAVLAGARRNGWPAHAVDESRLPAAGQVLVALGGAAGRPWRRYEKDAARAAMTLLPS